VGRPRPAAGRHDLTNLCDVQRKSRCEWWIIALVAGRQATRCPGTFNPSASSQRFAGRSSLVASAIVGLGVAADNVASASEFFRHLPPDTGMAFVVVATSRRRRWQSRRWRGRPR
jgi:hypothetical protein